MARSVAEVIKDLTRRQRSLPYDELLTLMQRAGCGVKETKEGCRITHPQVRGFVAMVARPHGSRSGNRVKSPYVRNCIKLLDGAREEQRAGLEEQES